MKIGIFDSGIGGLNVLKELISKYPNNHYLYYGDTINLPYGNKSKSELLKLSKNIIHFFEEKEVDLIIIACGTISSNCYYDLLKETKIPLYDIISPTINYIDKTNYQKIGLIGTTRTIESKLFDKKINKEVVSKDTPSFVPIIENNDINSNEEHIRKELSIFKNKADCLILGCTHYPLLNDVITKYLDIPLINMGICLLKELSLLNKNIDNELKIDLYFSLLNNTIKNNINNIIKENKNIVELK